MSNVNLNTRNVEMPKNSSTKSEDEVSNEDADDFKEALKDSAKSSSDKKESLFERNTGSRADAMLANLTMSNATEAVNSTNINKAELNADMVNKLVDNILVAANENKQEVLIKVNNAVLADTQIMLRMEEGKLSVQLQTANMDSSNTLHQNLSTLQTSLQNSCKDKEISVQVVEQSSQADGNKDGQGREDGRSRGRFLWENS